MLRETTLNLYIYPLDFIEQYGSNTTKRFIDDILTVAPGLPSRPARKGPTFEQIIKREGGEGGVYGGMYPEHILDDEGEQVANPVYSIYHQRTIRANSAFPGNRNSSKYSCWSVANSNV